jgi:type IV secretory pathway TrbL component
LRTSNIVWHHSALLQMIPIARMAVIGAAALLAFAAIGTIASIGGITTTAAYAQALGNGGHGTPRTDPGQPTD